jgi:hypothetical protein
MNANQIAALSAVASMVAAFASLLAILEMRRQRSSQLRPELDLSDAPFTLYRCSSYANRLVLAICDPGSMPADSEDLRGQCSLRLSNVRRGVAKSTIVRWTFDRLDFAAKLAPFAESVHGRVWVENDVVHFESDGGVAKWAARTNESLRLGAIPATDPGLGKIVSLDAAYLLLLASYYAAACDAKNMDLLSSLASPPLELLVTYQDVEGKSYKKSIVVRAELTILASDGFGHRNGEWYEIGYGRFVAADT